MLQNIWALSWKDSKPSDNSWWLEFSVGSATDMSGAWAGKTQNLDCGLQHLQVASPRSLGFLITWWPQHSGISYMVVQGFTCNCSSKQGGSCMGFYDSPWGVTQHHYCTLLIEAVTSLPGFKGREYRSSLSMGSFSVTL